MIENERQYRITQSALAKLKASAKSLREYQQKRKCWMGLLEKAELDGLLSECEVLSKQIQVYESAQTRRSG